jgi:hypothetical protein
MTPVRAIAAAFLAAVMVVAGALIVARAVDRQAADLFEVLLAGPAPGLLCFLAAAGAVLFGALGVLTAFLAFIAREEPEDDDRRFRRRGFPKSLPLILIILSLALVWVALRCARAPAPAAPIAVAVEPRAPAPNDLDDALEGAGPVPEAPDIGSVVTFEETDFDWAFKDPLIRESGAVWVSRRMPFADDASGRALCGKAWVAVTGSASEEGPVDRNTARSRLRAAAAAKAAKAWLGRHAECGATFVFGIDLGQHAAGVADESGAATAYQRRVLVMARERRDGEMLTADAARTELAAQIADPAARALLLGGRRFPADPVIIAP